MNSNQSNSIDTNNIIFKNNIEVVQQISNEYDDLLTNRNLSREKVIDLIAHSIKTKYKCERQRKDFVVLRTFPISKFSDPTFVTNQTKNLINCYRNIVNSSENICIKEFNEIKNCLNKDLSGDFPVSCVKQMEEYIKC